MPQRTIPVEMTLWRAAATVQQRKAARKLAGLSAEATFDYYMGGPRGYIDARNEQVMRCIRLGVPLPVIAVVAGLSQQKIRDIQRENAMVSL